MEKTSAPQILTVQVIKERTAKQEEIEGLLIGSLKKEKQCSQIFPGALFSKLVRISEEAQIGRALQPLAKHAPSPGQSGLKLKLEQ